MFIEQINNITNIGNFTKFNWTLKNDFKRVNIIYGGNGSGKTTLSNIFRLFSSKDSEKVKEIEFQELKTNSDSEIQMKINGKNLKYSTVHKPNKLADIYVFNSHFISEHVYDGTKSNMSKFDESVKLTNPELDDKYKTQNTLHRKIEVFLKPFLREKQKELDKIWEKYNNTFREKTVRKYVLKNKPSINNPLPSKTIDELKQELKSYYEKFYLSQKQNQLKDDIELLQEKSINRIKINMQDIANLLIKIPQTVSISKVSKNIEILQKLKLNNETTSISKWYEVGKLMLEHAHESDRTICPLCYSDITNTIEDLIIDYNAYFDDSQKVFQTLVDYSISMLNKYLEIILKNNDNAVLISELLKKYGDKKLEELLYKDIQNDLNEIKKLVIKKEKQPKQTLHIPQDFELHLKKYNQIVKNNQKIIIEILEYLRDQNLNPEEIITQIRQIIPELVIDEFNLTDGKRTNCEKIQRVNELVKQYKNEIDDLDSEIYTILSNLKKESELVNKFLKLFGIHHFEIDRNDNLEDNIIVRYLKSNQRKSKFKYSFSESEKTALALSYFFSKIHFEVIENGSINEKDIIVVIDDPISSLDEDRLHYTACLIQNIFWPFVERGNLDTNKDNRFGQLFIMSHNLIFLKFISDLLKDKPELRTDLYLTKEDEEVSLQNVPAKLKNYITTYFLKLEVIKKYADSTTADNIESIQYIPNYIRIVLETFFSFKLSLVSDNNLAVGLDKIINTLLGVKGYLKNNEAIGDINHDNFITTLQNIKKITDNDSHGNIQKIHKFEFISEKELRKACKNTIDLIKFVDNIHLHRAFYK